MLSRIWAVLPNRNSVRRHACQPWHVVYENLAISILGWWMSYPAQQKPMPPQGSCLSASIKTRRRSNSFTGHVLILGGIKVGSYSHPFADEWKAYGHYPSALEEIS